MNALERWFLIRWIKGQLKRDKPMGGFLLKFFSSNAIISRVIRGILVGIAGGIASGQIPLPHWVAEIAAIIAALISAGQNNVNPVSDSAPPKAVEPHA